MTIKETVLPLADNYAASALVAPFSDANAHDATQARAALIAALDAADRSTTALRMDTKHLQIMADERDALKAENELLRKSLTDTFHDIRAENAALLTKVEELETHNAMLRACIKGIIKVADRKTDEFDAARAALEKP